jgi:hypothetical protein
MRKPVVFLLLILLCFGIPLYAAGRIIFPDWLKNKIDSNLPAGAAFDVGTITSNADLSFMYEKVSFTYMGTNVELSELTFQPKLSLSKPLILRSPQMIFSMGEDEAIFKDVELKIVPSMTSIDNFKFEGTVGKLDRAESLLLSNIEFLISEISDKNITISLSAQSAKFEVSFPVGLATFDFESFESNLIISDSIDFSFDALEGKYDFSSLIGQNSDRIIFSQDIKSSILFEKDKVFQLPIKYSAKNLKSPMGIIAEKFDLSAVGLWQEKSFDCTTSDLFQAQENSCGKLVHVQDVKVWLGGGNQALQIQGNGQCVAKGSGCPQVILAEISSIDTAEVISSVMKSNVVNPLISGVLLGSLLGSPADPASEFDHSALVRIIGSEIYLNDKPLFN